MTEKKARPSTDWERVEAQYRAGLLTLREIATEHGISHGRIAQKAKELGWVRDLSAKIKAKADELTRQALTGALTTDPAGKAALERETVAAAAQAIAEVKLAHHAAIRAGREQVVKLWAETGVLTDRPELAQALLDALAEPRDGEEPDDARKRRDKLQEVFDRVASLPARVGAAQKLAEALARLVALERQAYKMDEEAPDPMGGRTLSDTERVARLAAILDAAERRKRAMLEGAAGDD